MCTTFRGTICTALGSVQHFTPTVTYVLLFVTTSTKYCDHGHGVSDYVIFHFILGEKYVTF